MTTSRQLPDHDGDIDPRPAQEMTDPAARPVRRSFTAAYKAQIAAEYEAAPHGEKSAVLRREGLYHSTVTKWITARERLVGEASAPTRRHRDGPAGRPVEVGRLRAENARLTRELEKSQAVVEIMGKLHGLLETISGGPDTTSPSSRQ